MGYVKKENMRMNSKGKPFTLIGEYHIVKESENMTGIYLHGHKLVTSKPKWSQAVKLAKLLDEAYKVGFKEAKEIYG